MNFIDKLKADVDFYEKHEDNLLNEVKLQKLRDIANRVRGIGYAVKGSDEKLQLSLIDEYVMQKQKEVIDEIDKLTTGEELINKPLLVIELQNETSIPKVFYKGEVVTSKINISFDWDTDTEIMGGLSYAIEHAIKDKGYLVTNRIERRVNGHAT